jgi:hypothetical protein
MPVSYNESRLLAHSSCRGLPANYVTALESCKISQFDKHAKPEPGKIFDVPLAEELSESNESPLTRNILYGVITIADQKVGKQSQSFGDFTMLHSGMNSLNLAPS